MTAAPPNVQQAVLGGVHTITSSPDIPFLLRYLSPRWRILTLTLGTCAVQKRKQRVCLSLNGGRCEATHPLERKEKKKKDKVADVLDHAGTQLQIVKGARKKRKPKDPETPVEAKPVSSNPEGKGVQKRNRDRRGEEPPSGDKKKEKRKKEKTSGAAYDPATDSPLDLPDVSGAAGPVAIVPAIAEEKRRKKNKSSDPPPASVTELTPRVGAADEVEKSRKRKPTKGDVVEANGQEGSKSKKRKKGDVVEDEEHLSTPILADDHSSRKRKKPKASVHPDPSDDPDLTEQSQKGSHPLPTLSESQNSNRSFDRDRSDLRLLPIHLARNLEVQQSPSKLDNPQRLEFQGED